MPDTAPPPAPAAAEAPQAEVDEDEEAKECPICQYIDAGACAQPHKVCDSLRHQVLAAALHLHPTCDPGHQPCREALVANWGLFKLQGWRACRAEAKREDLNFVEHCKPFVSGTPPAGAAAGTLL